MPARKSTLDLRTKRGSTRKTTLRASGSKKTTDRLLSEKTATLDTSRTLTR